MISSVPSLLSLTLFHFLRNPPDKYSDEQRVVGVILFLHYTGLFRLQRLSKCLQLYNRLEQYPTDESFRTKQHVWWFCAIALLLLITTAICIFELATLWFSIRNKWSLLHFPRKAEKNMFKKNSKMPLLER